MEKIYGMPCLFGTSFQQGKNCALALVEASGNTVIKSERKKNMVIKNNIFFIRGLEFFVFGLMCLLNYIYNKPKSKKLNWQIFACVIAALLFIVIFGFVSVLCAVKIFTNSYNTLPKRLLIAALKIIFAILVLLILKLFTPFRQFYRFNASINMIEKQNKKIHKPTNYLNFFVFSFFVNTIILSLLGLTLNAWYNPIINLNISVFVFGLCYEILLWLESKKSKFAYNICALTSFLITEIPTATEIYVAESAYNEVILMRNKKRKILDDTAVNAVSFALVYAKVKQKLKQNNIEDSSEADFLICETLGITRGKLRLLTTVSFTQEKIIYKMLERRIKGEPLTKIFERAEFYGLEFFVNADVLSPRMETELLVEQVIKNANKSSKILDIGTGSGAIAIAIAKFCNCEVTAVDISEKALAVASHNSIKNNTKVDFKISNLFECLKKRNKFDIIVSNPPYIKTEDIEGLDVEVKNYDPLIALDGGESGLEFYKKIIDSSPLYLKNNGKLFFELGVNQCEQVKQMLKQNFTNITVIKDYNKIERIIYATLK